MIYYWLRRRDRTCVFVSKIKENENTSSSLSPWHHHTIPPPMLVVCDNLRLVVCDVAYHSPDMLRTHMRYMFETCTHDVAHFSHLLRVCVFLWFFEMLWIFFFHYFCNIFLKQLFLKNLFCCISLLKCCETILRGYLKNVTKNCCIIFWQCYETCSIFLLHLLTKSWDYLLQYNIYFAKEGGDFVAKDGRIRSAIDS